MTKWFTADHHFGHHATIKACERPFANAPDMSRHLLSAWNQVVAPDDEVWVLGDLANRRLVTSLEWVLQLNGKKVLVPGDKDRCWRGNFRCKARRREYLDAGFVDIIDDPEPIAVGDELALMSHFPYRGSIDDQYAEYQQPDVGLWLLHGHVHRRWRVQGRQVNVGVDAWAGRPVAEHELVSLIANGPTVLPPLPWEVPCES